MKAVRRLVLLFVAVAVLGMVWATKATPGPKPPSGDASVEPQRVCRETFYHRYSYCTSMSCQWDWGCWANPFTPDGQVWGYYTVVEIWRTCYYDCETGELYSCDEDYDVSTTWAECGGCC